MQKYQVSWVHLSPDPPPGRQAGDEEVYFAADVEARIEAIEKALSSCVLALKAEIATKVTSLERINAALDDAKQSLMETGSHDG